jgi:hypothetical protein
MGSNMGVAYQQDFYTWTLEQTSLLKQKRFDDIDLEHIIEEIEDMGKSEKRALESYIENLLMHLLKWKYQPYYIGRRSWELTIIEQRKRLKWHIKENPGLKSKLAEAIERSYELAKSGAEKETGIPLSCYPEICPWTYEEFTDPDFWPQAAEPQ